jgi:monoamine oxidase
MHNINEHLSNVKDVIIIGAGLSGLSAAYYLKKQNIDVLVLEARERTGGRIYTKPADHNNTPVEMGATWFAEKHTHLVSLLDALKISRFPQYQKGKGIYEPMYTEKPEVFEMPSTEEPSYRICGGTSVVIDRLIDKVRLHNIQLNTSVRSIKEVADYIEVRDDKENLVNARNVIITIPPYLITRQSIQISPSIENGLLTVMHKTHTWMSDSIKFALVYKSPFWREKGLSGTLISQTGIATEVYDHTNFEESRYALKGFLVNNAVNLSSEQRQAMVVAQMVKFFGKDAAGYLSYNEKVWANDINTHADYAEYIMPHQNNGHPIYADALMNNKLYLSGSETSPYFSGYMDGAVYSGKTVAEKIIHKLLG